MPIGPNDGLGFDILTHVVDHQKEGFKHENDMREKRGKCNLKFSFREGGLQTTGNWVRAKGSEIRLFQS